MHAALRVSGQIKDQNERSKINMKLMRQKWTNTVIVDNAKIEDLTKMGTFS